MLLLHDLSIGLGSYSALIILVLTQQHSFIHVFGYYITITSKIGEMFSSFKKLIKLHEASLHDGSTTLDVFFCPFTLPLVLNSLSFQTLT